jgi:putative sigma-54 modulation protein
MSSSSPLRLHAEAVVQMTIHCRGFELTEGLHDYVSKRLAYCLSHGAARIGRVIVRLCPSNEPHDLGKRCHLELRLKGLPAVVIEDTEADIYLAIDRAAERAGRTLARRLAHSQQDAPGVRWEDCAERPNNGTPEKMRETIMSETRENRPAVGIVTGLNSDWSVMQADDDE